MEPLEGTRSLLTVVRDRCSWLLSTLGGPAHDHGSNSSHDPGVICTAISLYRDANTTSLIPRLHGLGMRLLTQHALTNAWQHANAYGPAPCSNLPHPCHPSS